ncbi:MAG: orotidine-5'-phosphate decarboxylase [Micrococcales bacterium]
MANLFGTRLLEAFAETGQLCVGIDPHSALLQSWGLTDDAKGLREFGLRVIEAAAGRVSTIKPQVSFFERFGAQGYSVLAELTNEAHSKGLLVIADAKRGDIGTTMDAYLEAWFGENSGLYADALTVSPYLGLGATSDVFTKWITKGKGIYSLVATSNPQGGSVQLAAINGTSLAGDQWKQLSVLNGSDVGPYGAVIGATLDLMRFGIDSSIQNVPILAPGFGAQGALLSEAKQIYGELAPLVSYSVSRSVLAAGSDALVEAINQANLELKSGLTQ